MKVHNKSLAQAAQNAGIMQPKDYAIFQNRGYQGLYGGLGGTMPEDLPTPSKSIKQIEREEVRRNIIERGINE